MDAIVRFYLILGLKADRLNLGIPAYGRVYKLENPAVHGFNAPNEGEGEGTREVGASSYWEICLNLKNDPAWTFERPYPNITGPYAYKDSTWVSYDDSAMVRTKAKYVIEMKLGGVMFWSLDHMDYKNNCGQGSYPLIRAAKEALGLSWDNKPIKEIPIEHEGSEERPPSRLTYETTTSKNHHRMSDAGKHEYVAMSPSKNPVPHPSKPPVPHPSKLPIPHPSKPPLPHPSKPPVPHSSKPPRKPSVIDRPLPVIPSIHGDDDLFDETTTQNNHSEPTEMDETEMTSPRIPLKANRNASLSAAEKAPFLYAHTININSSGDVSFSNINLAVHNNHYHKNR